MAKGQEGAILMTAGDTGHKLTLKPSADSPAFLPEELIEYSVEVPKDVFYDPAIATKELVDQIYGIVNNRTTVIKTLAIAKSAIRHNMSEDLQTKILDKYVCSFLFISLN